jgi:hypothetical protein
MPDPNLRAADTDREAVAGVLGRALSEGRLTVDEYEDRLTRAYTARTYGELEGLTTDLPHATVPRAATGSPLPVPPRSAAAGACGSWARGGRSVWAAWLSTALIVTVIWLTTSIASHELQPFWPIWVIAPWGAVLLGRTLSGQQYRSRGPRR